MQIRAVMTAAIENGHMGVGNWNRSQQTFFLSEEITGYSTENYHSFRDFLKTVVYPLDRDIVFNDLENYLQEKPNLFRSTFRILTKTDSVKWVLIKGKLTRDPKTQDDIFQFIFYDVSGSNFQSGNDVDTNLLNRDFFQKKVEQAILDREGEEEGAIIGINIANYQSILDVYGSRVTRLLFQKIADELTQILSEDNEIAKMSSENFVALVYDFKNQKELDQLTESITQAFQDRLEVDGQLIRVEVNLGVATFPDDSDDATELLLFAEYATVQSKQSGKYQIIFFNKELSDSLHRTLLIEKELAEALKKNEFYLMYQPQIDASTEKIIGVEVLVRWTNDKLGTVSPADFIPMAENHGYMIELGQFILEEAIQTVKSWLDKGLDFGTISINVSPVELMNSEYTQQLIDLCEKSDFPQSVLRIEITEGVYMESISNSLGVVKELIDCGFKIAVDDFGTGYSNFSFLSQAKLDTLKIDKSLIDQTHEESGRLVVQGIVNLAKSLNYNVLAEGVETKEQVTLLENIGCHWIQGYYYSKPLVQGEMEDLLESGFSPR